VGGPTVSLSAEPGATDVERPVSFVGLATGGTVPYAYRWSFGDLTGAATADVEHNYTAPGRFAVNLTVTDMVQGLGVAFTNVTINALPHLSASASNLTPLLGSNVSFSASVVGGTAPFSFSWSFGDGNGSATAGAQHRYSAAGTYAVVASVVDSVGAVSWQNFSILVAGLPPPPPHRTNSSSGLTPTELLGIGLVVVGAALAAAVAVVLLLHRRRREPPSLAAAAVGQPGWDDDSDSPATSRTARRSLNRFYRRRS